ncbi:MAG: diguanylate cyclase [Coriobacteriales bacterium]|nr:diguanylate cyclase [Coriobacteriales bacterium]
MVIIFQYGVAIVATAIAVYALTLWHQRRMMYFALFSLVVALQTYGYLFEVTASDLDGAIIAVKVTYLGSPFLGSLYYLFARDFANQPQLKRWQAILLLGIPAIFTLAVLVYPYSTAYYADLGQVFAGEDGNWQHHLVVSPGLLYFPCFAFNFCFTILGTVALLRGFVREQRHEARVIFIIACVLPIVTQTIKIIDILPGGWNPMPTVLTITIALLGWYLARFRQTEWQSTGRELIVENMRDGFILADNKGRLLDSNLVAQRYFPALATAAVGQPLAEIEDFPSDALGQEGLSDMKREIDGTTLYLRLSASPLISSGIRRGTSLLIFDNTENQQMLQKLTRLARHDELTTIFNRATFFDEAARSFDLCQRTPGMQGCALMLDIDFFKQVNDTYGHAAGDEVLRYMGRFIISRLRHTDICGRYGGEELCAWLPGTSEAGALKVAEECRELISAHDFQAAGQDFKVTVSIGLASTENAAPANFADLMHKADAALYRAKHNGRNQVRVFDSPIDPPMAN